jgi:hypothetical protein
MAGEFLFNQLFYQLWLHWGFASRGRGWKAPVDEFLPEGTKKVDDKAVQSPFKNDKIVRLTTHQTDAENTATLI